MFGDDTASSSNASAGTEDAQPNAEQPGQRRSMVEAAALVEKAERLLQTVGADDREDLIDGIEAVRDAMNADTGADVCTRCGTDFSIARRAQRQATALARVAVQALARGETRQAAAAAAAASQLANPLLAQAVARVIRRREDAAGDDLPRASAITYRETPT